jgi:hypothetical protein
MPRRAKNVEGAGAPTEKRWSVDASLVAAFARYPRKGKPAPKRLERPGLPEVLKEIYDNQETLGARAGVTAEDILTLQTADVQIATTREYLGTVRQLAGILEYTEADVDEGRHRRINAIATAVDRRLQEAGNEDLALRYAKTRAYRSAIAVKAVRTRRRRTQEAQDTGGSVPVGKEGKEGASKKPSRKAVLEGAPSVDGSLPANDASK